MKINHKYDVYGRTEPSIIYLAKPGKRLFCALGGIDSSTVSLSLKTNNTAELTFTVDKYTNNALTDGYEELDELMEIVEKINSASGIPKEILEFLGIGGKEEKEG